MAVSIPTALDPIRPEFTFSSEGELIHHCGNPGEYLLGVVEEMYCSRCFEPDGQASKAASAALKAFKEHGGITTECLPKMEEVKPADYATVSITFVRAWRFIATCEGSNSTTYRYHSLVVLTPQGTYAVTACSSRQVAPSARTIRPKASV